VNWAKRVLTLLVLANWFACIVHCQAEQGLLSASNNTNAQFAFQTASHGDGNGEDHVCDWVATGGYKASESHVVAPKLNYSLNPAFAEILPGEKLPSPNQVHAFEWSNAPPEQRDIFLFVCRTALPVRAPSFVS
jgi:hypothetical protein